MASSLKQERPKTGLYPHIGRQAGTHGYVLEQSLNLLGSAPTVIGSGLRRALKIEPGIAKGGRAAGKCG